MEKSIITLLKSGSAVIYVLIFCLILSIPVIFIYQAVKPPVFTFEAAAVEESFTGDEVISEEAESWHKIQFTLSASAGRFSPYSFYIEEFSFSENVLPEGISDYRIVLDEPIFCTKDQSDTFTLSVYIKGDTDINEFIKDLSFKASDYTKSFGEFKLKFEDGKAKPFKK